MNVDTIHEILEVRIPREYLTWAALRETDECVICT